MSARKAKKEKKEEFSINEKLVGQLKILLEESYITPQDVERSMNYAKEYKSDPITYLLSNEVITKDLLGQAIAENLKVLYVDLNTKTPHKELVIKIPETIAKEYNAVLSQESDTQVLIATSDPHNPELLEQLKILFNEKEILLGYSLESDIENAFKSYRKPLDSQFMTIIQADERVAKKIIEAILEDATIYQSSDIHLEPNEDEVRIRFRIDGVLQNMGDISKEHYENILNWIKVTALMRIDEHFSAQDGSIRVKIGHMAIDLRVSIIPVLDGEKIVMRILSQYIDNLTLSSLGLSPRNQQIIQRAIAKPFGMILVTGPTGSGKTTTLYALLKMLNKIDVNITTIEDPVEYKIKGVNHIQVNTKTGLTFSRGLRAIVRQDPNIILVGEIRDEETAEIAVNAALTGHLLLSTFHANSSAASIPRLLDMGIESFLLSSTLEVIAAQRLVRKLCERCRYSRITTYAELKKKIPNPEKFFPHDPVTIYEGKGCKSCGGVGYKGRTGIYEFIENSKELQDLILKSPSANQIWELAESQGAQTFFEDGILKVRNGVTSLDELLRVARVTYE